MLKVEKDGGFTLAPDGEEVSELLTEILALVDGHAGTEAVYALAYALIFKGCTEEMKMSVETLHRLISLLFNDLKSRGCGYHA